MAGDELGEVAGPVLADCFDHAGFGAADIGEPDSGGQVAELLQDRGVAADRDGDDDCVAGVEFGGEGGEVGVGVGFVGDALLAGLVAGVLFAVDGPDAAGGLVGAGGGGEAAAD